MYYGNFYLISRFLNKFSSTAEMHASTTHNKNLNTVEENAIHYTGAKTTSPHSKLYLKERVCNIQLFRGMDKIIWSRGLWTTPCMTSFCI